MHAKVTFDTGIDDSSKRKETLTAGPNQNNILIILKNPEILSGVVCVFNTILLQNENQRFFVGICCSRLSKFPKCSYRTLILLECFKPNWTFTIINYLG